MFKVGVGLVSGGEHHRVDPLWYRSRHSPENHPNLSSNEIAF